MAALVPKLALRRASSVSLTKLWLAFGIIAANPGKLLAAVLKIGKGDDTEIGEQGCQRIRQQHLCERENVTTI